MITKLDITQPVKLRETFFMVWFGRTEPCDFFKSFWRKEVANRYADWLRRKGWTEIAIKEVSL